MQSRMHEGLNVVFLRDLKTKIPPIQYCLIKNDGGDSYSMKIDFSTFPT
jgi:hypothetical protein